MTSRSKRGRPASRESGFALILAIMALVLLTFLGLTLAATTSSELQIASNYRWGQQALYNAEAGIEAGKVILRNIPTDWGSVLPAKRGGSWPYGSAPSTSTLPAAPSSSATRNYENAGCDQYSGLGYGGVLDDTNSGALLLGATAAGPYENVRTFLGSSLNGTFTLWVRRDLTIDSDAHSSTNGNYSDSDSNTILILTAEGSAPNAAGTPGSAVRVLQVRLSRGDQSNTSCLSAEGQTGISASGANFGACAPLNAGSVASLVGAGAGGGDLGTK